MVNRLFELAEQYFDRPVAWLDAGEPVPVSCAGEAAEHHIEIKGLPVDSGFQHLPNHSFDVISFINITEHVKKAPERLQDAIRVLKQDGLIYLTTQDPLLLSNPSLSLRPPSYWMYLFKQLQMNVCIRFGEQEYQVEILAAHKDCPVFNSLKSSFLTARSVCSSRIISNSSSFHAVTRSALSSNLLKDGSRFYVLNTQTSPVRVSLKLRLQEQQNPDVFLDDLKLRYAGSEQENGEYVHQWKPVTIPPGGQTCRIQTQNQTISLLRMEWESEIVETDTFTNTLPFDHYQRYHIVSDILTAMPQTSKSILDVGGARGYLQQFIQKGEVIALDTMPEDSPNALRYEGKTLPFPDNSFHVVTSLDTLEHIPPQQRDHFISELCRVAEYGVILACPFDEMHVHEADSILRDFLTVQLGKQDRFLSEHEEFTLPKREATRAAFAAKGFSVAEFPSGYLPRWVLMQLATFALGVSPELQEARADLNAIYNRNYYPADNTSPSYRYVMLATPKPVDVTMMQSLRHRITPTLEPHKELNLAPALVALSTYSVIREKDTALTAGIERIDLLLKHITNLETRLLDESVQRQKLLEHTQNLDRDLNTKQEHIQRMDEHSANLQTIISELQTHIQNQDRGIEDLQTHINDQEKVIENTQSEIISLNKHIENIETLLKEKEDHTQNMQHHVDNLTTLLQEKEHHAQSITSHAENLTTHIQYLEQQQRQLQNEMHHARSENRISQWYFNTFLPQLYNPGCDEQKVEEMLFQLDGDLGEMPEAANRFLLGMKELCRNAWKEQEAVRNMQAELQTIQTSAGYKILSKSGVIPKKRKPKP